MIKQTQTILSILFLLSLIIVTMADEITIVADPWCPFSCEPGSSKPGYMVEVAQKVFAKAGHTIKYSNLDWDVAIEKSRKGEYNGIIGAYIEDAPDFVFPANSLGNAGNVFFVKEDEKWKYTGIASLSKIKVGKIKGYSYGDALDKEFDVQEKAGNLFVATGDDALGVLVDKLMSGEIQAIIEDPAVLSDYLVENVMLDILGQLKEAGNEGKPSPVYIAFSPKNPKSKEYAKILSDGIQAMIGSGEMAKILLKYEIKKWW